MALMRAAGKSSKREKQPLELFRKAKKKKMNPAPLQYFIIIGKDKLLLCFGLFSPSSDFSSEGNFSLEKCYKLSHNLPWKETSSDLCLLFDESKESEKKVKLIEFGSKSDVLGFFDFWVFPRRAKCE